MAEGDCMVCRALLDRAARSISDHLRALTRLDLAVQGGGIDLLPLELAVRASSQARKEAVASCRTHRESHEGRAGAAGSGEG